MKPTAELRELRKALKAEIAVYRRDEQDAFEHCGPTELPGSRKGVATQTAGRVSANHADRLDLMLEDPAEYNRLLSQHHVPTKGQEGR